MRIDENILLMRSKSFFRSQESLDWTEIAELTAGVLERWKIRMALFDLEDNGDANLKFHSMEGDSERWWEGVGGGPLKNLSMPLSKLAPLADAVREQKVVYVESAELTRLAGPGGSSSALRAIFAPLMDEKKPFGVLAAMSEGLRKDDTLIISLIAHELSALIGGSELIRELRQSELLHKKVATKYRDLIDRLDDAIIMADSDGNILAANERLRKGLDTQYPVLMKMKLDDIVYPKDRETLKNSLEQARKSATRAELRMVTSKGDVVHTEVVLTYSPEGESFQGIFRMDVPHPDAAREKNASHWFDSLAERRARKKKDFEALFDSNMNRLPALVFFMNQDGKIMFVSSASEKVTGFPREDFLQHPLRWLERVHPLDREKIALAYQKAVLTGEGHSAIGFKFMKKFGKVCEFLSTAIPLMDAEGRFMGVEGIFQDITHIIEQERQQGERERRRSVVFENLNDLIFVLDLDYRIQMVNPSCEAILGRTVEEMEDTLLETIVPPSDMEALRKSMETAAEDQRIESVVIRAAHKNGTEVFLEINATPVIEDGKAVAIRGVARDVTERVRLEERERALQKELAQKEKMAAIGELLATVSHGIRNPLASIRAVAQNTMEEIGQENPARIQFRNIIVEADRLETRIKEFLSFYRPFEPDLKSHDINGIIAESLDMVAVKGKEHNIDLALDLDRSIPPVLVDFAQIEQVLLNLIGNALGATPDGGSLRVSSSRVETGTGERAEVSIEDSGLGIPDNLKERVFQPFFTTKAQGTGMGLSMSKRIIEAHGGGIKALDSKLGGARLTFWIPILVLKNEILKK